MDALRLDRVAEFLTSTELFLGLLWAGLAALSITLLVLMRTRWGQFKPLRKCLVLSLLAHLLLAGYATTVQIWSAGPQPTGEPTMRVALADDQSSITDSAASSEERPWEQFVPDDSAKVPLVRPEPADVPKPEEPVPQLDIERPDSILEEETDPESILMEPVEPHAPLGRQPEVVESPKAQRREAVPLVVPIHQPDEREQMAIDTQTPERETQTGLPSVLQELPSVVPRVAEQADTVDASPLVSDATDLPTHAPQGDPAEKTADASTMVPVEPREDSSLPASGETGSNKPPEARPDPSQIAMRRETNPPSDVPEIYRARLAPDRVRQAEPRGATQESEKAVHEGLKWLAANQRPDGRWSASQHGAGRETRVDGEDRRGAGARADSGVTGLALLAFLAAGNTHKQGDYRENVARGLDYLMGVQQPDGNLGGEATLFAKMYCHAMATFALSEAYAMTDDTRLERPVRRAIGYTVAAQDPQSGGWRYTPRSKGDTSQLGWQLMALRSATLAGIPLEESTRRGALHFLRTVSSGRHGGLASYRPGEQATRPMTAEAMVCRQLLGMPPGSPTAAEAADYLLGELPGEGPVNLYYWYYSTLALHEAHGNHWERWNRALQKELVGRQRNSGTNAGSWDPETVWGGYGGRVYSTAMATLCLEVYYRYLPSYLSVAKKTKTEKR